MEPNVVGRYGVAIVGGIAARITRNFLNERLEVTALGILLPISALGR